MTLPLNHRAELHKLIVGQLAADAAKPVSPYVRAAAKRAAGSMSLRDMLAPRMHVDNRGPGFVVIEGDRT